MGLWNSFASAVSSCCSAVSSAFGSVCSAVNEVLSDVAKIAPEISSVLGALAIAIPSPHIKAVIGVINTVLQIAQLLHPDETVEGIGDRVLQAQELGISPTKFSTYDEYMEEIRNFKLDSEKEYNFGERVSAGIAVQAWGMEEKLGVGSSEFLSLILNDSKSLDKGVGYFTEERVEAILKAIDNISDVSKYFKDDLDPATNSQVEEKLVKIDQELHPDKTIDDIYKDLGKQIKV